MWLGCLADFIFYLDIIYLTRKSMNQRPFSPVTGEPFKVENYYFQLIFQRLIQKTTLPRAANTYTFAAFKGSQKYQTTRPINLQRGSADSYSLEGIRLNFVAISYNPSKSLSFEIRIIEKSEQSNKEIGEYVLDANNYIDHFTQTENGAFTIKMDFNDDWAAEAELYLQRSRYGVERLIKDVKNPKPKQNGQAVPISHQSIKEKRRKLDLEEEEDAPHTNRFKKFSPKRDAPQEVQKKNQYFSRKNEETQKREIIPEPKKEEKKSPKGGFVPKKEWIIPEAEKYMAKKTKTTSRTNSIKQDQKAASAVKEQQKQQPRRRPKPVEEPSVGYNLPIKPKYLILIAITIALLSAAGFFFLKNQPEQDLLKPTKQEKPKKTAEKPVKPQKTVKVRK